MQRIPAATWTATAQRVALDQLVFAPAFIAVFFSSLGALEGKSAAEVRTQLEDIWAPSVVTNWAWWVPVQAVNLGLVPPRYQVLASNGAGVVWNVFLSFMGNKSS